MLWQRKKDAKIGQGPKRGEMSTISDDQIATRRRALGRRLIAKASAFTVDLRGIQESPDLAFLNDKERSILEKQLDGMSKLVRNFNVLGERLDK